MYKLKKTLLDVLIIVAILLCTNVTFAASPTGGGTGSSPTTPGALCPVSTGVWAFCNTADVFGNITYPIADAYFTAVTAGTITSGGLILTGNLNLSGNDIEEVDSIFGPTAILPARHGDASTTSHSLDSEDDLLVTGELEVDGSAYFDLGSTFANTMSVNATLIMGADNTIYSGATYGALQPRSTAQTPDTFMLLAGASSNNFLMAEYADRTYDFAHALQTDPTLFINSANQSADEWISFAHDQTNGVIDVGTGSIVMNDAVSFLSSATHASNDKWNDGAASRIEMGTSADVQMYWNIAQTPHAFSVGVGSDSNVYLVTEKADLSTDFANALKDDPTIIIQSNDATDVTENLQLSYVGADDHALIETGDGNDIKFGSSILAGAYEFAEDAGFLTAMDMSVSATPTAGDQESYTFKIDGESFLKIFAEADSAGGIQNPKIKFFQPLNFKTSNTVVMVAGTGLTITEPIMQIDSGAAGAVTITATPSIVLTDMEHGDCFTVVGDDDTNTITFQDESNLAGSKLQLAGGIDFTLGIHDNLELCYNSTVGTLWEKSRSDN